MGEASSIDPGERDLKLGALLDILGQMEGEYRADAQALQHLWRARNKLARTRLARPSAGAKDPHAPDIVLALELLPRIEWVLLTLERRREEFEKNSRSAPSRAAALREFQKVRDLYLEAVASLLEAQAMERFKAAEQAASALPRALLEVDLTRVATRPSGYESMESSRKELGEWVKWLRVKLDTLERHALQAGAARRRGGADVSTHEHTLRVTAELIQLSVEALGYWEQLLEAHTYLEEGSNFIPTAYISVSRLVARCRDMKNSAMAEKLEALRGQVIRYRDDPDVAFFLRGLPLVVAGSPLLVSLGVTLVASVVTAGVGGMASGALNAARAGAGVTFVGTVAIESLTFTAVSRGVQGLLPGEAASSSWWSDLAWNLGLFSAMRGLHRGTQALLHERGLPPLAEAALHKTGSFGLLQAYGALHHRVALGQWPTEDEWATMTAHNVILLMGLTVGLQATQQLLPTLGANSATARFLRAFGARFRALGEARDKVENTYRNLQDRERPSAHEVEELRTRARLLEEEFRKLVSDVEKDPRFNIQVLREEGKKATELATEASSELLARLLEIPNGQDALRPLGGPGLFSYAWGRTNNLESRWRAMGAEVRKTDSQNKGLRVLRVRFGKEEAWVTLKERPSPYPASREVEFDTSALEVTELFKEFGITNQEIQRYVLKDIATELAKNPSAGTKGPLKTIRNKLKPLLLSGKSSVQEHLRQEKSQGRLRSQTEARLLSVADRLERQGILSSKEWRDSRVGENFRGVAGEWLAIEKLGSLAPPDSIILSRVQFKGILFEDAALTIPARSTAKGLTDVTSELDALVVTESNGRFHYSILANVKMTTPQYAKALRANAIKQNRMAVEALQAHQEGRPAQVETESGRILFGQVHAIIGYNARLKTELNLAGRVAPSTAGFEQITILPRMSTNIESTDLLFTCKEVETITELLREKEYIRTPEY